MSFPTDLEIAQSADIKPIKDIAKKSILQKMIWNFMESIKPSFHYLTLMKKR